MDASILARLVDTLRKLTEIEAAVQDTNGPQPCPVAIACGGSPEIPASQEEKNQLFRVLLNEYAETIKSIGREYFSPMEFTHGAFGKAVGYLNSTSLKLPGDEETVRRAVQALSARFFYFPRQCPNQLAFSVTNDDGATEFIRHELLSKQQSDEETDKWLASLRKTAEARQIADELDGIAQRLRHDKPVIREIELNRLNLRGELARNQRRRGSLSEAADALLLEKKLLVDLCYEYDRVHTEMLQRWAYIREAKQEATFPATGFLDSLEKIMQTFVEKFSVSHMPHTEKDVDWDRIPERYPRHLSEREAAIAFQGAREIVALALDRKPFRALLSEGWIESDLVLPECGALREVPEYVRLILHIMSGHMDYPKLSPQPDEVPGIIERLKELTATLDPWTASLLSEFRFKMELLGREHQRLHLTVPFPDLQKESPDAVTRKLDEILKAILDLGVAQSFKKEEVLIVEAHRPVAEADSVASPSLGTALPQSAAPTTSAELSDTLALALRQYIHAQSVLGSEVTDKDAFKWLTKTEDLPEDLEMVHDEESQEAWLKALTRARKKTNTNKNRPRRGRESKSARRPDEI